MGALTMGCVFVEQEKSAPDTHGKIRRAIGKQLHFDT